MTTLHDPERRPLGRSGLRLAPIVLGTMARRGDHPQTRLGLFQAALDSGITDFDTAPLYGFGAADRLLGQAIRHQPRSRLQILSKVGLRWDDDAKGQILFAVDGPNSRRRVVRRDSRPEAIVADVEASLDRLGVDYLDLVQIHHPDSSTSIDETMAALLDLKRRGWLRAIGVSNFSLDQLRAAYRALGSEPLASTQENFSLIERTIEPSLLPYCAQHEIGVLAYSPLAGGLLAAPERANHPPLARLHRTLLVPLANRYGVTPAAIAAAWAVARPGITAAIVGASDRRQLDALLPALRIRLADDEGEPLAAAFRDIGPVRLADESGTPMRRALRRARGMAGRWLRRAGVDTTRWRRRLTGNRWG